MDRGGDRGRQWRGAAPPAARHRCADRRAASRGAVRARRERGFEIGRRSVHTGPRYFDFKPVETLFRETTLARPTTDERVVVRLREAVASSAAAAAPGEPAVMVAPWRPRSIGGI